MKLEDVKTIGVLGAGVMGGGIAQTAIVKGYKVIIRDLNDEILEKTKDNIIDGRFGLKGGVARGKMTEEQMNEALANLTLTTKVEDLKDCDLVIEAIGGDKLVKKEAIFASNTSMFTIADIAVATERKDQFIGMHWFSPANIMKVVEVIWTADTSKETIETIEGLCDAFGKIHVRIKDVPGDTGFIGNRIFAAIGRETRKILEEGIVENPEDVDKVMMGGFNWPAGPISMGQGARGGWK